MTTPTGCLCGGRSFNVERAVCEHHAGLMVVEALGPNIAGRGCQKTLPQEIVRLISSGLGNMFLLALYTAAAPSRLCWEPPQFVPAQKACPWPVRVLCRHLRSVWKTFRLKKERSLSSKNCAARLYMRASHP